MARGIFLHRADSIYDDRPELQYQFPKQYLSRASQFVGDWIIYYEPRRGPTSRGYYAIARVERIIPDPISEGMYIALIEPDSYLPFEKDVPFSGPKGPIERGVLNEMGNISGRAQAAVRPVSIEDFNRIIDCGLPDEWSLLPRTGDLTRLTHNLIGDVQMPFQPDGERERVTFYSSRIVRDRVFRRIVLDAYDCRCAITGLKLINGGGRAEVEAAHIKPVEAHGPDIVTNGLALSGTAHWMFDRGLISLGDDLEIRVSRQVNDPESVWGLVNPSRRAIMPLQSAQRPHPSYLAWHREHCFKN
ncbi:HNH endonuclease [Allosphingosinicella sp.]|uniref:HNH endonuclease n=1 Tax=Allosphingosinicella sp. TaxID=2823234 RepID=UPI0037842278